MSTSPTGIPLRVPIWGTLFSALSLEQSVTEVDRLVQRGGPSYFVTANVHSLMIADADPAMRAALDAATFVVADGMPIVWAARVRGARLPERVAGSDLLPALCELASQKNYRVFFLGGAPEVRESATDYLTAKYPGLCLVGFESPPFRPMTGPEEGELMERIRAARPHLLFLQYAQPKGELWIHRTYLRLGVPVSAQFGASLDFMTGQVSRAPRWVQRVGMEWVYRISREPRRLIGRYVRNARFLAGKLVSDGVALARRRVPG